MARITSSKQFNIHNFSFHDATDDFGAHTVVGTAGGYRYGIHAFDNTMTTTYNSGTARLTSYSDDLVRPTTGPNAGHVTGGAIDAFTIQDLVGTSWRTSFAMSDINGNSADFDAVLRSGSSSDDSTFLINALGGNDLITLSSFNDDAHGYGGNDTIRAGLGNDWLAGEAGTDMIDGGSGLDSIYGGDGNDNLIGGRGVDILTGGNDNDTLRGGDGNDILTGGPGSDTFSFHFGDDRDTVTTFSQGSDMLQVSGMTATTAWTATQEGSNTVIGVMGIQIVLEDTTVAQMSLADFLFA
jgi:Ca2+-binding RTX toxin-like protein